jgi:peptidoglycan/xylan/chitin deacetylase (PgdA/CDA1 family)
MGRIQFAARVAARAGFTSLLECAPAGPYLFVLNYHRIGDGSGSLYDAAVFSATADEFEAQVAWLKSRYHIATLTEARDFVRRPGGFRHPTLLLTFDDGYLDNYMAAYSILRSHSVPATFFLATSYVGSRRLPWWDAIAFVVKMSRRQSLRLSYPEPLTLRLDDADRNMAVRLILRHFKSVRARNPGRFMRELADACGMDIPEYAPERLFLDWPEAAEMRLAGMDIGSHTHSHELLGKLAPERQLEEASLSGELIRRRLGSFPLAISYPVGKAGAYTADTFTAMEAAGYELGFSFYGGVNRRGRTQRFDVRRSAVDANESLDLIRLRTAVATRTGYAIQ